MFIHTRFEWLPLSWSDSVFFVRGTMLLIVIAPCNGFGRFPKNYYTKAKKSLPFVAKPIEAKQNKPPVNDSTFQNK